MHDVVNNDYGNNGKSAYPKKVCIGGHCESGGAADFINVKNDDANDLGEPQGNNSEIVTTQAQRRNSHYQSGEGRNDRTYEDRQQENQCVGYSGAYHSG